MPKKFEQKAPQSIAEYLIQVLFIRMRSKGSV